MYRRNTTTHTQTRRHIHTNTHSHTCDRDLLVQAPVAAVELQEERRGHCVAEGVEAVTRINHHIIQKFCRDTARDVISTEETS